MPTPLNLQFTPIAKETNQLYKKNFLQISGIIAITSVAAILLVKYIPAMLGFGEVSYTDTEVSIETTNLSALEGNLSLSIIFIIILALLGEVIDQIGAGGVMHFNAQQKRGKEPSIAETLQFGVQNISKIVVLIIQIFIYTWAWLPMGIILLILVGIALSIIPEPALAFLPIVILIAIAAIIRRVLSVVFATPYFFIQENPDSTKALEESIANSRDILATIFVNYLILSLILGIIGGILGGIVGNIIPAFGEAAGSQLSNIISDILVLIPAILMGGYAATFSYIFALKAMPSASETPVF